MWHLWDIIISYIPINDTTLEMSELSAFRSAYKESQFNELKFSDSISEDYNAGYLLCGDIT